MKSKIYSLMAIVMMACLCVSFVSCGDDDDDTTTAPKELFGSWYKTSGADKYSMSFTFDSDGTGYGNVSHNKIISYSAFTFTYKYKANGDVVCDYIREMVDEESEQTGSGSMTFNYNAGKLTFTKAPNSSWEGAVFSKD